MASSPSNETITFTSSHIKIPSLPTPTTFCSLTKTLESSFTNFTNFISSIKSPNHNHKVKLLSPKGGSFGSVAVSSRGNEVKGVSENERLLISEVVIRNRDGEELERKDLEGEVREALKACKQNAAITWKEVQEDVERIMNRGYFRACKPVGLDTRDGIRMMFQVEPNPEFQGLVCEGANVLPSKFVEDKFRDGYGKTVNSRRLLDVLHSINGWYRDRGLFGQVQDLEILSGGIIRLQVLEAEVNNVVIRFLDRVTGELTTGKTRPETILRQLTTKKGQVYSQLQGKRDIDTLLTMGTMDDASIIPQPTDTGKVDLILNLIESGKSRGFSGGGGVSPGTNGGLLSGLFGSFSYSHRNVAGRNQKLNVSVKRGQIDSEFRVNYTDPWIDGDDKRTSRSIMVQNSRTPGSLVHGNQPDNSTVTIGRVTSGIEFSRPFRPNWSGTCGLIFQRANARDGNGNLIIRDYYNSPLTASGNTHDDMLLAKLETVYTDSGDRGSSKFVFNVEQGLPVMPEWLYFNRINARASKGFQLGPIQLLFSLSGGHVVGNFCPHEAFAIGGTNSVRGYEEGVIGSGRSYVVGSGEVSFPLYGPVRGAIFRDHGSDLGSGPTVPGDPAGARLKPGSGYGYGLGIRMESPLGPLRLEYAFNDQQVGKLHIGLGNRF